MLLILLNYLLSCPYSARSISTTCILFIARRAGIVANAATSIIRSITIKANTGAGSIDWIVCRLLSTNWAINAPESALIIAKINPSCINSRFTIPDRQPTACKSPISCCRSLTWSNNKSATLKNESNTANTHPAIGGTAVCNSTKFPNSVPVNVSCKAGMLLNISTSRIVDKQRLTIVIKARGRERARLRKTNTPIDGTVDPTQ
jgi:hypothetical protein